MKIICIENCFGCDGGEIYATLRPDSSMLRENDDFYIPAFSSDIVCGCGITVRINRLAKCIDPRFADRCYDSVGAGVAFFARDTMRRAIAAGHPCDEAYCFDRSLAVSPDVIDKSAITADTEIAVSVGAQQCRAKIGDMRLSIDECISRASQLATLKTGDIVYIGMPADLQPSAGDEIKVAVAGECLLDFGVK